MPQESYINQLLDMSSRIAELNEMTTREPAEKLLVSTALEELSLTIEELRVADEEIRTQAEELASAQDAIEDQRYRYEEIFEFAPDAYIITDAFGRIQEANQAAARLLNISQRLLTGKPLITFIPQEERQEFVRAQHKLEEQPNVVELDIRLRPRRGEAFAAAASLGVVRDRRGVVTARRWLLRDATARRQAEEERYHRIVSEITDYAIFRIDTDGRIRTWNKGAEQIFGYLESEVVGRHLALIFPPEDRAHGRPVEEMEIATRQGRWNGYGWRIRKDGSRLWAESVLTALYDGTGKVTGFVKILRDYTDQKRAEEALTAAYERQHRIADTLQSSMLQKAPRDRFPGLDIEILYQSALNEAHVGGDFFDTFALEGNRVALVAGDVSGKGLAAAARTTEVRYALRAFLDEHPNPSEALGRLNDFVCRSAKSMPPKERAVTSFVALAVAVIDRVTGEAEFAAAGLEPAVILCGDGSLGSVEAVGMPLGVEVDTGYTSAHAVLEPGEILLMATDGLTEVRIGDGFLDQAGLARLAIEIRGEIGVDAPLENLGKALMARVTALAGGSLRDDACLLLARRQ